MFIEMFQPNQKLLEAKDVGGNNAQEFGYNKAVDIAGDV